MKVQLPAVKFGVYCVKWAAFAHTIAERSPAFMRKLWYSLFYSLCAFTIAFSLYWMATVPPRSSAPSPAASSSGSSPALGVGPAVEAARLFRSCDNDITVCRDSVGAAFAAGVWF